MRCGPRRHRFPGIFIFFVLAMIFWSGFSWWMWFFILPFAFRFVGSCFANDDDRYDDDHFPGDKRKNDEKPKRYIDTVDGDRLEII